MAITTGGEKPVKTTRIGAKEALKMRISYLIKQNFRIAKEAKIWQNQHLEDIQ